MTYKLTSSSAVQYIRPTGDVSTIPADSANVDYLVYQEWLAAGGVPDPVDPDPPNPAIDAQIAAPEAVLR